MFSAFQSVLLWEHYEEQGVQEESSRQYSYLVLVVGSLGVGGLTAHLEGKS